MLPIPELLAPAGGSGATAICHPLRRADAVYCGSTEFGMRAAPGNFTPEQLAEGAAFAHARGKKIYPTMNTLPTNEELERIPEAIQNSPSRRCGCLHRGRSGRAGHGQAVCLEHRNSPLHPGGHSPTGPPPRLPMIWEPSGWCWLGELDLRAIAEIRAHVPDDLGAGSLRARRHVHERAPAGACSAST